MTASDALAPEGIPDDLPDVDGAVVLPTFALLARFPERAPDAATAVEQVRARLAAAGQPSSDLRVEREERDGLVEVEARFVLASTDEHVAVAGLSEELRAAGLEPDEVWVGARLG